MRIAPYSEEYRLQVQEICLLTGPGEAMTNPKVKACILSDYCNYYIENEAENCFVLLDDENSVQGYVICAPDYTAYRRKFKPYAAIIRENAGLMIKAESFAEQTALRFFSRRYPAHLHIDLKDEYTGKGYGSELIETLTAHLKEKGVSGVMIIAGSGNTGAVRFYRRHGFKKLISLFGGIVMGKKL